MDWKILLFMAIVVEAVVAYFKTIVIDRKVQWQTITAILIGIGVSVAFDINLFSIVGISSTISYVPQILTGILISRGSDYIVDFINAIGGNSELTASR